MGQEGDGTLARHREAVPRASAEFSVLATDLSKVFKGFFSKVLPTSAGPVSGIRLAWHLERRVSELPWILDGFRLLGSPGVGPSILHVVQLQKGKHAK